MKYKVALAPDGAGIKVIEGGQNARFDPDHIFRVDGEDGVILFQAPQECVRYVERAVDPMPEEGYTPSDIEAFKNAIIAVYTDFGMTIAWGGSDGLAIDSLELDGSGSAELDGDVLALRHAPDRR